MKKNRIIQPSIRRREFELILLKMKLLIILFYMGSMVLSASTSYSQKKIDLQLKDLSLTEILNVIESKSEFIFVYNANVFNTDIERSITVKNENIEKVLNHLFQGTNISYFIDDRQVFLFNNIEKRIDESITLPSDSIKKKVSGKVTDENGEPIPGTTVSVTGFNVGTTTNADGMFTIDVPSESKVLSFSFIGYVTQEIPIGLNEVINVSLKVDNREIKEVLITAQAKGQKNAIREQINSNNIKNVVASDRLQENPDANATEAIGRLPGISVVRSGGEGVNLVVRGLEPRYTSISLNGIQLPSTSGSNRNTNLSGITQYALQGAEVYKSLTADMDANSVGGTVNLKLRNAPNELHVNLMAQFGYNQLNDYWGNYKVLGELSNRFFNNKLGVLFTANAERVNRSTQTMGAGYGIDSSDPEDDILLNSINLNDITTIIYRRSVLLNLDYKVSPNTSLILYGMYSNTSNESQMQMKNYGLGGSGSVGYSFAFSPDNKTNIFQSSLSGDTKLEFLSMNYGISYSKGKNYSLKGRTWAFTFNNASSSDITDINHRKMDPVDIVPLFTDSSDNLMDCWLKTITTGDNKIDDKNLTSYLNFTVPFNLGEKISGNFKFGGMHRVKKRYRDDTVGSQNINSSFSPSSPELLFNSLDWAIESSNGSISAVGISGEKMDDFLNGEYNFGNKFNIDRLNQISDAWEDISNYYLAQGADVYLPLFGEVSKIGYSQAVQACMINDQDIKEKYTAGYLMSEINFGKYVMFLPGIRLENTHTDLKGFSAISAVYLPPISEPVPGTDTSAVRSDHFLLPMIHLRIKPTNKFYIHLAYTETLSRADFNAISPNYFINSGWSPFSYSAGNPELKSERWTNFDGQLTYHSENIGLLSLTAFYKTVNDKIWQRSYQRIKGDAIIYPFPDNATVNMTVWENHPYKVNVKGFEVDWQTSFHYLPKPIKYFTLSANYTFTKSKTSYPYTRIDFVAGSDGRPVATRIDSIITGPMLYQPKHIANISLGYNKKGFNAWLSFQYNGKIFTGINYRGVPRLNAIKDYFYRWDLQLTQKFAIRKIKGFEVIANIANISDFTESQRYSGDSRNTYRESYGWTTDLGLRYRF
uniref:TonB-dependent receptor n=1 Tax=uncultured Draconibacterium sp. TaxID=1573823 RepID=UPI003217B4FD